MVSPEELAIDVRGLCTRFGTQQVQTTLQQLAEFSRKAIAEWTPTQ